MFFWWLVFTSNLISQTTWLKVKLKLVNLIPEIVYVCADFLTLAFICIACLFLLLATGLPTQSTSSSPPSPPPTSELRMWNCFSCSRHTNNFFFLSETMDIFCLAGSVQQAQQLTHLAEALYPLQLNSFSFSSSLARSLGILQTPAAFSACCIKSWYCFVLGLAGLRLAYNMSTPSHSPPLAKSSL